MQEALSYVLTHEILIIYNEATWEFPSGAMNVLCYVIVVHYPMSLHFYSSVMLLQGH